MEFDGAMKALAGPPMGQAVAMALGVHPGSVSRGRMLSVNGRPAPRGWRTVVRRLAQQRIDELEALLEEMAEA